MKNRKLIAKSNLKKSIYLGGGMAAFTAVIGLAVSIPVYNKIQAELAKSTSKLKDLSGMMSQLTNKLGIPEGASFQKELEGGYEVVYENGQTKIYKNNGEGKSLIINMNGDGTVGSAASMQGPAAQAMLGVIQNAQETISQTGNAMDDIIGPFANQAEDESLRTEAAITGTSVAALAQRNAMSAGDDEKAKAAAAARLAAIAARNKLDQATLDAAKDKARELKIAAEAAKEQADKLAAAKKAGDAALLKAAEDEQANASIKLVQDFVDTLNWRTPPAPNTPDASDAPGHLSDNEIISLVDKVSGWAKEASLTKPLATEIDKNKQFLDDLASFLQAKIDNAKTNDQKNEIKTYFQTQKIAAADQKLKDIRDEAAKKAQEAKEAAIAATTSQQMSEASSAGKVTPAIVRLAKSLPNAINALISAKYGYLKKGVLQAPSESVQNLLESAMKDQGVSQNTLNAILNKIVAPIHDDAKTFAKDTDGKYTDTQIPATVTFTEVVNTFDQKETSVSRLLVLKASYVTKATKEAPEVTHETLFLAKQTTRSPLDFEGTGDVLQSISNLKSDGSVNSLYTAASYLVEAINRKINPSITNDAVAALKKVVDNGVTNALNGIKNPAVFNQLVIIAKAIDPTNRPIQEKALVEILLSLAKKYLFEGKDVKVDGMQLVELINNAFKYDGTKEPTLTLDATKQDFPNELGSLTKKIIEEIGADGFTNYSELTSGGVDLVGFVSNIPSKFTVDEVVELMNDPTISADLPNLQSLYKSDEGKNIIENNWPLAKQIIHRTDVAGALKIIKEDKIKALTSSIDDIQKIFATKNGNLNDIYTKLMTIANNMPPEWIKNNKDLIIDNISNDNLLKMVVDPNKDMYINDSSRRSVVLLVKDIDATLSNLASIKAAWGSEFESVDPEFVWFADIAAKDTFNDIIKLFIKTTDDKMVLSSFNRIKQIVVAAEKALAENNARTDIYDKIISHISQLEVLHNYDSFYKENLKVLINMLTSDVDDITQTVSDVLKYVNAGNTDLDLTNPEVMQQVAAASAVTAKIAGQGLDDKQQQAIGDKMTGVIANAGLTKEQFEIVSKYTETVFKVFTDKDEAAEQLKKVLDPGVIKDEIAHIDTFNKWVEAIEGTLPKGTTITKEMIEKYVWTKDITRTPFEWPTTIPESGSTMIVSAVYNPSDKKTYFVDHIATSRRPIATLEKTDDGKTKVTQIVSDVDKTAGGIQQSAYITGQVIHENKLYWMGINDAATPGHVATVLYVYDLVNKKLSTLPIEDSITGKHEFTGTIRTLSWANGKLYGAISERGDDDFIEMDPKTGKYKYLGADVGLSAVQDKTHGKFSWSSGAFYANGHTFIIMPRRSADLKHEYVTVMNVDTGKSSTVDIVNTLQDSGLPSSIIQCVGIVNGAYDEATHIQTIFYVDYRGVVVKLGVNVGGTTPTFDNSKTLALISKDDNPEKNTRGATFIDGKITVYGGMGQKVVYIADQTKNLNDIFKFLMEH